MRAGIDNRLHGAIISAMELTLFMIPFSVVEYMPNFFYGRWALWPVDQAGVAINVVRVQHRSDSGVVPHSTWQSATSIECIRV